MHCWGLQFGICIDGFFNAFSRCVYIFHGVCFYEPNILITNQETCPPPSVPDPCVWHPNVSINLTVSICVAVVLLMFYCVRMATSTLVMVVLIAIVLSGQSTYDWRTLNDVNSYATCRSLRILWHVQKQVGSHFCNSFRSCTRYDDEGHDFEQRVNTQLAHVYHVNV